MNILFIFSLILSGILALIYPICYLLVNRCRDYSFNRLCLLFAIAAMVLFSLSFSIHEPISIPQNEVADLNMTDTARLQADDFQSVETIKNKQEWNNDIIPWLIITYWTGILFFAVYELCSYFHLYRIIKKTDKKEIDNFSLCTHSDRNLSPFSWGKYIVVNIDENNPAVILHEKAHTKKKHWIDLVFADLFCIVVWYNPFSWLLKNLVKLNHEYEADREVIDSNIVTVVDYQRLLIGNAIGNRILHVTNNFAMNSKNFRRRILTMNRRESSHRVKWITIIMIPAITLAAYANTTPWTLSIRNYISNYKFESGESMSEINIAAENADSIQYSEPFSEELPVTLITKRLPSPLTDPEPLLKQFEMSMELADKDLIPDKILVRIQADEEGNIVSATTDHDDNPEVRVAVDRATNQIAFEVVKDGDRKVSTRFALPIRKASLPM